MFFVLFQIVDLSVEAEVPTEKTCMSLVPKHKNNGSFIFTEMGTDLDTSHGAISLWLQLYDVESPHWTKTGTDTRP